MLYAELAFGGRAVFNIAPGLKHVIQITPLTTGKNRQNQATLAHMYK